MSNDSKAPFAPNKATCDLLRGLAAQFWDAGETYPEWRHYYQRPVRPVSLSDAHWLSLTRLDLDDPRCTAIMEDAKTHHSDKGGWGARKFGWHLFRDLVNQTWLLLPESLKGQNDNPEEGWYAIVYDRLAGTPLVNEWRGDRDEFRELAVNSFKASAMAIQSLLAEWGEIDAQPVAGKAGNSSQLGHPAGEPPKIGLKRSTVKGEARDKIIAALTLHHKYRDGTCLNWEPITVTELARQAGLATSGKKSGKSSASRFLKKQFGGHEQYRGMCRKESVNLVTALKLLNQEFTPQVLFGRNPHGERTSDDED